MASTQERKKITIVSPCYNDKQNVEICYRRIRELFEAPEMAAYEREHLFADNASTDGTQDLLRSLAADDPCVKVIINARNYGVLRSTFNALRSASGDAVLVMMAVDLQDPPELIPQMAQLWEQGYEVVQGVRRWRQEPLVSRTLRHGFYALIAKISDIELTPGVGEFQLIDRKVWEAVTSIEDSNPYIRGIIAACGFKTARMEYTLNARAHGMSHHKLRHSLDLAFSAILAYSRIPTRIISATGLLVLFGGLLGMFCSLFTAAGGAVSLIAALIGLQMLFVGIVAEYVTTLQNQVRWKSFVAVRERINFADPGEHVSGQGIPKDQSPPDQNLSE